MFDKFGEFDRVEELNKAAAGLKAEGDAVPLTQIFDCERAFSFLG